MPTSTARFGAHELIAVHEALSTKQANIEVLSFLANEVQNQRLSRILEQQVQAISQHYAQGSQIVQNQQRTSPASQGNNAWQNQGAYASSYSSQVQPKFGFQNTQNTNPSQRSSQGAPSERAVATVALNIHKFGAVAWTTLALECTNPQLRTYLMQGAHLCDKMAYDIWSFLTQQGYYQVPTFEQATEQAMMQSFAQQSAMNYPSHQPSTYQ